MRRWGMVRAAAVVFLAGGWIGLAGPALAVGEPVTGTCDALLVDAADELSPAEETEVQAAAGTLRTDTSFEPRVWVLTQEQDGRDLAEWIELQTDACDTWHAGVSDLTSNFVVLAVTTDAGALTGETYLWYGDAMPDAMDQRFPEIQADVINPALTDGDYARGLVDGLAAIGAVIDPGPPIGWIVAGAVVLLGAAAYGGYRWRRARKERQRIRAEQASRFEAAAAGSDEAVLQIDQLAETLDSDVQLVRASYHPDEAEELLADVTGLLSTYATLTAQRLDLMITRDQVLQDADDATLADAVAGWEDLNAKSDELLPALGRERDRLEAALRLPESIPTRVAAVPTTVDLVRDAERTARDLGFTPVTEVAPLASVPAGAAEVRRLAEDRRYTTADTALVRVETDLEEARAALTTLPERLHELTTRVDDAAARRADLTGRIDDARAAGDTLAGQFHPAIAAEVAGAASSAADDAARADGALTEARAALDARDLGRVATALIAAEDGLGQAEAAAALPGAMLDRVRRLATEVPPALAGVRSTLAALRSRVRPATPAASELGALQARADAVTLPASPDWPRVEAEVSAIHRAAGELAKQLDEAARADAARRRAQAARDSAGRSGGSSFMGGSSRSIGSSWRSSGSSWSSGGSRSRSSGGSRGGGGGSRSSGGRRGGGSRR